LAALENGNPQRGAHPRNFRRIEEAKELTSGQRQFEGKFWLPAWSPDGKRLATASADQTAKVWEAATGRILLTLSGHENTVHRIAWSPDGERLATASADQTARVWDAATGRLLLTFLRHWSLLTSRTDFLSGSPRRQDYRLRNRGAKGFLHSTIYVEAVDAAAFDQGIVTEVSTSRAISCIGSPSASRVNDNKWVSSL
jgi:WD40 repeat protein